MKQRVARFAGIGAIAGLVERLLTGWGVTVFSPLDLMAIGTIVVAIVLWSLPVFVLWALFYRVLPKRPFLRLLGMIAAYCLPALAMAYGFLLLTISQYSPDSRLAYGSMLVTGVFTLQIALLPLILGTPNYRRSAKRLCIVVLFHLGYAAFLEMVVYRNFVQPNSFQMLISFFLGGDFFVLAALFAALAPDHIAMQRAALARKSLPLCEKCEYDLTGNVSGVCPECGTVVSEAVRQRLLRPRDNARASEFTADQS